MIYSVVKCSCEQGEQDLCLVDGEEVRIKEVAPPTDRAIMGHGSMAGNGISHDNLIDFMRNFTGTTCFEIHCERLECQSLTTQRRAHF